MQTADPYLCLHCRQTVTPLEKPKRTIMGFPKLLCPLCKQESKYPLSPGYTALYGTLVAANVLFLPYALLGGGFKASPFGMIILPFAIVSLVKSARIKWDLEFINTTPPGTLRFALALLVRGASKLQSPLLLAIRLYWGWQFVAQGTLKFRDHMTYIERFIGWNIPFPSLNVYLAGTVELVGGILLFVGLASRLAAFPLIFTMLVAYLTAEPEAVKAIFSDPDQFVSAAPFMFLLASVIVLVFGPGIFSIDHLLARRFGGVRGTEDGRAT
ncbi:MAG TPA: DoxX family protein [Chthoniobacteraceae bacterium]|jgi:putative oxidoreductase|nr:DoxX family protein [Chthoniobacteraceae bacterium]